MLLCATCGARSDDHVSACATCAERLSASDFVSNAASDDQIEAHLRRRQEPPSAAPATRPPPRGARRRPSPVVSDARDVSERWLPFRHEEPALLWAAAIVIGVNVLLLLIVWVLGGPSGLGILISSGAIFTVNRPGFSGDSVH